MVAQEGRGTDDQRGRVLVSVTRTILAGKQERLPVNSCQLGQCGRQRPWAAAAARPRRRGCWSHAEPGISASRCDMGERFESPLGHCRAAYILTEGPRHDGDHRKRCCLRSVTIGPGGRGTTRGTSTSSVPVQCVLSGHPGAASAQAERPERPGCPLLIRGLWIGVLPVAGIVMFGGSMRS